MAAGFARGDFAPGRHLRLVGDEEIVQVARHELRRRGLSDYDLDYVLAVEAPRLPEKSLHAVIVVVRAVGELRPVLAVRVAGDRLNEGPAGEAQACVLDVVLRIVAHAHREELEELAGVVLVGLALVVLLVVKPVQHGRISGEPRQDGTEPGETDLAEHVDLAHHIGVVLGLVPGGREDVVPE